MKKILICTSALIFVTSSVFADFIPPQLRLSGPDKIHYDFTGDPLNIDVNVSGSPAALVFLVYTKDKADKIVNVQNGYLGWHLMNRVDTCVYMSDVKYYPAPGINSLTWDGKINCGGKATGLGLVPAGEYTYYLWGFDYIHPKIHAVSTKLQPRQSRVIAFDEKDVNGLPDPHPIIHLSNGTTAPIFKWAMGGEPTNDTLVETSITSPSMPGLQIGMTECFDPNDRNILYVGWFDRPKYIGFYKFNWVPNGIATRDPLWGADINIKMNYDQACAGITTDGTYMYSASQIIEPVPRQDFLVIDFNGNLVETISLTAENERRGYGSGSGVQMESQTAYFSIRDSWIHLTPLYKGLFADLGGCYKGVVDYHRYAASGDIDLFYVWGNGNGDYIGDKSFQSDAPAPWSCGGAPNDGGSATDVNQFSAGYISAQGTLSFHLFGPDGLGIGNFGYAGEINGLKMSMGCLDNGSAYDGYYSDNLTPLVVGESVYGVRFCPQDSFKGIITNKSVDVEENEPVAISVAQNLPNPFNPTTTIGFTLPNAGMVSIDVYNVAGQKVDTIINEHVNTGSHSVVWDASGFSAGVYFYTVKFNNFTKSMKMTLVK